MKTILSLGKSILITVFIAFLLVCVSPTFAQEDRPALEEALKWFPIGDYGSITHCDNYLLSRSPLYREHEDAFEPSSYSRILEILPPSLREDIDSFTRAQRTKIQRFEEEDLITETAEIKTTSEEGKVKKTKKAIGMSGIKPEKLGNVTVGTIIFGYDKNEKMYALADIGSNYLVFRYDNLDSLITKALEAGEIEPSEEHIRERTVYTFWQKDRVGKKLQYLAYATPTQELLVSHSAENLRDMVAVGRGESLSFIDQPENQFIYSLIDEMGPRWICTNYLTLFVVRQKLMVALGADPEKIATSQEEIDNGPAYFFETEHFDIDYTNLNISRYHNEGTFRANLEQKFQPFEGIEGAPQKVNDYYRLEDRLTAKTADEENSMLIIRTVIEEDLLARKAEAQKLRREWFEEQRKKEEQGKQ